MRGKPIFHLVPPNIVGEEQNVSVLISQAVELLCQSDAIPSPTLTWLKDGRPLLRKPGLGTSANGSVLVVRLAMRHFFLNCSYARGFGTTPMKLACLYKRSLNFPVQYTILGNVSLRRLVICFKNWGLRKS